METLFIYLDGDKNTATRTRIIRPSEKFDRSWSKLAEALTGSDFRKGVKRFHSTEII